MYRIALIAFFCILIPSLTAADDAGRALVKKAIEAHGGADNVAKLRVMRIKAKGTMSLMPGQPNVPFVIEDWWQMPDQYKTSSQFELNGKTIRQTQVIDGKAGWIEVNGHVKDLPKMAVAEMRSQKGAEDLDRLGFLDDKEFEITFLREAKVEDQSVLGVAVTSKATGEVILYFNKKSGRLAKREHKVLDPATGKKITQEVLFGDYETTNGVPHSRTLTVIRGGKELMQAKIVEIEFFSELDNKIFAKP